MATRLWVSATRLRTESIRVCASAIRTSTVPSFGCGRTSHQMKVASWKAFVAIPRSTIRSNSAHEENDGGSPERGNMSKIFTRVEASPVGRACQNGELAESASSSGRNVRTPFAQAIAVSGESIPTCTCRPKMSSRSATQRMSSASSW